jgi:hypothetical protein
LLTGELRFGMTATGFLGRNSSDTVDDFHLAADFLFAGHIIHHATAFDSIRFTGNHEEESHQGNSLLVDLSPDLKVDFEDGRPGQLRILNEPQRLPFSLSRS